MRVKANHEAAGVVLAAPVLCPECSMVLRALLAYCCHRPEGHNAPAPLLTQERAMAKKTGKL